MSRENRRAHSMSDRTPSRFSLLYLSSDKYPPFRVDISVLFGKKLASRGFSIDWLLQSESTAARPYREEWGGGTAFVGPTDNGTSMAGRAKKHLLDILNDLRMFSLLRKKPYDALLVRDKFFAALLGILAAKIHGNIFIYWLSYPFPEDWLHHFREGTARYALIYFLRGRVCQFLLYRIVLPLAGTVFVQSRQMLEDIAAYGVAREKMTPVPMGVNLEEIPFFGYDSERDTGGNDEKAIVYLGTLVKTRRMDFLVRMLARVLEEEKRAKLYLVGGGEDPTDEQLIVDEAKRLGIEERVVITGFLPQREAWQFVKRADVCVSPFFPTPVLNSTSPTKLIEYMAMGKASVANDHPDQSLVLSESGAGICVPYEEDAFARAVLDILLHPETAKEMGIRGRRYVEKKRSYAQLADLVQEKLLDVLKRTERP